MRSTYKLLLLILLQTLTFRVQAESDARRVFRKITAADGLADNSAQTIKCTKTGRMTITTLGNINFFDGANFSYVSDRQEARYRLEDYTGRYHLYFDNNHHLWLKNKYVVTCVNLTTETVISRVDSVFATYGIKDQVNDLFIDVNGDLWVCVNNYLYCNKYNRKIPLRFPGTLQDLAVYDSRFLLTFYSDGMLICYDLATGRKLYENPAYGPEDSGLYQRSCVHLIHKDNIYLIRNSSEEHAILLRYNVPKRQWTELLRTDYHLNNMVVHNGKLYIASGYGYLTDSLATGEIKHYPVLTLNNGRKLETSLNTIDFDLQGGMWVGTERQGLLYDSPIQASFNSLPMDDPRAIDYCEQMDGLKGITEFKGKSANMMYIDSRQWTWVATPNGLYMYTSPQALPVVFSRQNGLLNNVVHTIVEDNRHYIWVGTSYGISCVQIENKEVKQVFSFNHNDNVPNETFVNAKVMKLPTGEIVMQAIDHVVTFDPADFDVFFHQKAYPMQLKLTKLMVNGIDVTAGDKVDGEVILDRAITRVRDINLNYDQNSVSLTFSALNYARPRQTYYRVRVMEISPEWKDYSYFGSNGLVDGSGLLHLPLLALDPGTYHIEVLASVVPGEFVGRAYQWTVNVNQPWWRTTGILSGFGFVVIGLAVLNFFVYNRNTRLKMRRNSEEGDVIRRIKGFVERCDTFSSEKLSPTRDEIYGVDNESMTELSDEFIETMLKIVPYVHELKGRSFSMNMLSRVTDMELVELYALISENIHKSPRALICSMRIDQVAEKLRTTDRPVEELASECGFISPNYMIAKFFHEFRMTPDEYREEFLQ